MAKCTVYLVDADGMIIDETEYENADEAISTHFNRHDGHGNRYHIELNGNPPPYPKHRKRLYGHVPENDTSGSAGADRPGTPREA